MKTTKKALLLALCAVLLVVSTVFATMAYLTSTTEVVKNTFTVGNVKITLDEAKVNEYGVKDGDTRVTENTYKLMPGHTYTKDPTIHVDANSEDCWLFVKIVDEIAEECPQYLVAKLNVDEEPELSAAFGVSSIPTLVVMQDGKIKEISAGERPKAAILAMLQK